MEAAEHWAGCVQRTGCKKNVAATGTTIVAECSIESHKEAGERDLHLLLPIPPPALCGNNCACL